MTPGVAVYQKVDVDQGTLGNSALAAHATVEGFKRWVDEAVLDESSDSEASSINFPEFSQDVCSCSNPFST